MNDEQRKAIEAEKSLIQTVNTDSQIRTARQLMIIPSLVMIIFGLIFMYFARFKNYADNTDGMWQSLEDFLIIMPFFLLSVIIAIVCMIIGLMKLHRARSSRYVQ